MLGVICVQYWASPPPQVGNSAQRALRPLSVQVPTSLGLLGAGGSGEDLVQVGELLVGVPAEDLDELVGHVHLDKVGDGRGRQRGPRGGRAGGHRVRGKERLPGGLPHLAVLAQAVIALEGLHRSLGVLVEAARHLAVKEAQVGELVLQPLHPLPLAAVAELARIAGIRYLGGSGRRGLGGVGIRGGDHDVVAEQALLGGHIRPAVALQAVILLEIADGGGGAVQVVARNLAPVVAQLAQPGLEPLHVFAAGALLQGPEGVAVDDIQRGEVRVPGRLHAVGVLQIAHGLGGLLQVVAADRAGVILQHAQPGLQAPDVLALVALFQRPAWTSRTPPSPRRDRLLRRQRENPQQDGQCDEYRYDALHACPHFICSGPYCNIFETYLQGCEAKLYKVYRFYFSANGATCPDMPAGKAPSSGAALQRSI